MTRYPIQNALDLIARCCETCTRDTPAGCDCIDYAAQRLGRDRRTIAQDRIRGVSSVLADTIATRLGFAAWQVWPDWELELRECRECGEPFALDDGERMRQFCEPRCKWRHDKRRRSAASSTQRAAS